MIELDKKFVSLSLGDFLVNENAPSVVYDECKYYDSSLEIMNEMFIRKLGRRMKDNERNAFKILWQELDDVPFIAIVFMIEWYCEFKGVLEGVDE